ncbi:NADH dehydrogenase [ubiquinone] 1 beta subcomplex subunit 5, mitochondrial [Anthophora quadrimaculata]
MAVWSRFLLATNQKVFHPNGLFKRLLPKNNGNTINIQKGIVRSMSSHHVMDVTPSRWQWHKTKDWMHFYFFVGAIPAFIIIFCANVFVGPATLEPIPEGYTPKPWEYYRSPISRFLSKYCYPNPQQEYEKYLHYLVTIHEQTQIKFLEEKMRKYINEYGDYPYWSYKRPLRAKCIIELRKMFDDGKVM